MHPEMDVKFLKVVFFIKPLLKMATVKDQFWSIPATCKLYKKLIYSIIIYAGVGGIVVSIAAFQAVDPGSIPGQRNCDFKFFFNIFCPDFKHA